MFSFRKRLEVPTEAEALPGRQTPVPVPARHFVNGNPLEGPFPEGVSRALFGMGCFWGAERKFWVLDGVYTSAVGYAGGITPNPTYEEVCTGLTGHNEVVLVVFDPRQITYQSLLEVLGVARPDAGNAPGQRHRYSVPLRHIPLRRPAESRGGGIPSDLRACALPPGIRRGHHGNRRCAGLLLRRALPPAVSRQDPARLLRAGRNRGALSGERLNEGAGPGTASRKPELSTHPRIYPCDDGCGDPPRRRAPLAIPPRTYARAESPVRAIRRGHHGNRRCAGLLRAVRLRRALPPAVSRQDPARLLRAGRNRGALSGERLNEGAAPRVLRAGRRRYAGRRGAPSSAKRSRAAFATGPYHAWTYSTGT